MMKAALFLAAALIAVAGPALAAPVELRADTVADGPVTLGDLFDGAGAAAEVVVAPAARPGVNLVLDAGQVQRAARAAGLEWDNAAGVRRIVVHGVADAPAPTPAARRAGKAVEILTYARNLNAGEIVRAEDLTWGEAVATPVDAPRDAEDVIGKAAKKPLRAGAAVAVKDLAMPQVIKRDDMVQVSFRAGGIILTLQGKALEAAALGDPVSIQNAASKKVIEAVATGPGQAVVGPEAERLRASLIPSTLASR